MAPPESKQNKNTPVRPRPVTSCFSETQNKEAEQRWFVLETLKQAGIDAQL